MNLTSLTSTEFLDAQEAQLRASLIETYPHDDERSIVDLVLIPQLRKDVEEFLEGYVVKDQTPLSTREVDRLCEQFDAMLEDKKNAACT